MRYLRTKTLPAAVAVLAATLPTLAAERLDGYAEFRDGKTVIVDGQVVLADDNTKFKNKKRNGIRRLPTIPLGYEVKVTGQRLDDGSVLAKQIAASRNTESATEADLKGGSDRNEAVYLQKGRMVQTDPSGRLVADVGELLDSGQAVDRARRITYTLVPPYLDPENIRVYVVDNPEWNAMAAPNYAIYIFSGLLDDMDDDEVAIVLGHELAHATHEHGRRQFERGEWLEVGIVAAGGLVSGIDSMGARTAAEMGTLLAGSAVVTGYSREHEDQADRVGLRYAHEAGYDVTKGPALWERFAEKYGETDQVVNFFFGDHSRSSKRQELLAREIELNYTDGVTP